TPGPRKPGTDSFSNHRPFEFRKDPHHLEHRLAGGGCRVEAPLAQEQGHPEGGQRGQAAEQSLAAWTPPGRRQGQTPVAVPARRITAQLVECRALVAAPGAADAVIFVDLDNLTAYPSGDLAQFALLIGGGLIDGGNAEVENRSTHGFNPSRLQGQGTIRRM